MKTLTEFLRQSAEQHNGHLCPRQVLGVRMGMYVADLIGLDLPQRDKRLFVFVETDGCLIDGIATATGCTCGHRTMRILDYGKSAATFVDTGVNRAIRIMPHPAARTRALAYAPVSHGENKAPDRWEAQLQAYQLMPDIELFSVKPVELSVSLAAIISKHGLRVVCDVCGEDIINERQVIRGGQILCRPCAGDSYCRPTHEQSALTLPDFTFAVSNAALREYATV